MKRWVVLGALAVCVAGCGGSSGLSGTVRAQFAPQVAEVRRAAESFQPDVARQRLRDIREQVTDLRRRGEIDDDSAARVLAAVADVEARLALAPTPTTTTARPPVTTTQGKGESKGNGKGKSNGEDD